MIGIALQIASQFAPGLVRQLAGDRAGNVAEQIIGLGRTITGVQSPEEIEAALTQNAAFAHDFRTQAASLEVDLEKAYLADRGDARDMRLELARMGRTDWMMYAVGGIVISGFVAAVLAAFLIPDMSEDQSNLIAGLTGSLGAMSMMVVSYFFGSSRGSAQKTAMMASRDG